VLDLTAPPSPPSDAGRQELGLSCPEELFDFDVFLENPKPFFSFARNLYFPLGDGQRVRPSDSHKLLALLEQKNMLLRVYSQNIDGLEQKAGVSSKRVVYAHGSLQWATCCKCKRKVSAEQIEANILEGSVARCQVPVGGGSSANSGKNSNKKGNSVDTKKSTKQPVPQASREPSARMAAVRKRPRAASEEDDVDPNVCGGVMKPGVTFFGEALHDNVRRSLESDQNKVDALIVIGTSLSVYVLYAHTVLLF